jgi:hypothetical protein
MQKHEKVKGAFVCLKYLLKFCNLGTLEIWFSGDEAKLVSMLNEISEAGSFYAYYNYISREKVYLELKTDALDFHNKLEQVKKFAATIKVSDSASGYSTGGDEAGYGNGDTKTKVDYSAANTGNWRIDGELRRIAEITSMIEWNRKNIAKTSNKKLIKMHEKDIKANEKYLAQHQAELAKLKKKIDLL